MDIRLLNNIVFLSSVVTLFAFFISFSANHEGLSNFFINLTLIFWGSGRVIAYKLKDDIGIAFNFKITRNAPSYLRMLGGLFGMFCMLVGIYYLLTDLFINSGVSL